MTATTTSRDSLFKGFLPQLGTYPMAAGVVIPQGTLVAVNATGFAVVAVDDNNAFKCVGVAGATADNTGGAAGDTKVEVVFGLHAFGFAGTPIPGSVVFAVDNQTVSTSSDSGTRGIAGYVSEVIGTNCWVLLGPTVAGQIVIAAAEAADLDTAQIEIDALQADALTAYAAVDIPLGTFAATDGTPLAKFADGATPTFGLTLVDSKAFGIRWNNHATPGGILTQVGLPVDLDDTAAATLECVCSKTGATLGDATTITAAVYIMAVGDLHDADTNCGGASSALVGNAIAKTTAMITRAIAHGDIPANARSMTLSLTPTAGTLGTDDLILHSVRLRYQRKMLAA